MVSYIIISAIVFFVLAIVWNHVDWFNLSLKIAFGFLAVYGGLEAAVSLGYLVKV